MKADALIAAVGLTGIVVVILIDLASFVLAVFTTRRLLINGEVRYRPLLLRFEFSSNPRNNKERAPRPNAEVGRSAREDRLGVCEETSPSNGQPRSDQQKARNTR